MQCCPAVAIITLTVAELSFQHVVFILCYVEGKNDWAGAVKTNLTHTQKCKHGITVGIDEIELTGQVEIKPSLMADVERLEVIVYNEFKTRLCEIKLYNDRCIIVVDIKYECRCVTESPPFYTVVFRTTIERTMTESSEKRGLMLSIFGLVINTKQLKQFGSGSGLPMKSLIPEPTVIFTIDNVSLNVSRCIVRKEVGSSHVFKFCTHHLFPVKFLMDSEWDMTARFGNETCATKTLTVEYGETKLNMLYEDQCGRQRSYSCLISGSIGQEQNEVPPKTETESMTRSHKEPITFRTRTYAYITTTKPPMLLTSQSFLILVVSLSIICALALVATVYLIYNNMYKDDTSVSSYFSSDTPQPRW